MKIGKKISAEELERAIKAHGQWLKDGERGKCLRLEGFDLRGINFSNVNLSQACFIDCNLKEAIFEGVNLVASYFSGSRLELAHFQRADMHKCCIARCDCRGGMGDFRQSSLALMKRATTRSGC